MLLNCGIVEDSWGYLGLQEIKPVHPKGNQSWIFIGKTDAKAEAPILWPPDVKNWPIGGKKKELTHWKRPCCWERCLLKAGGEGDKRGWGGWMASPTWWTWVWTSSGSWWWTGKPGLLAQSMESQRVGHDWVTELNWDFERRIRMKGKEKNAEKRCVGLFPQGRWRKRKKKRRILAWTWVVTMKVVKFHWILNILWW